MPSKYLFFYLKTGGGHLAPAKSIAKFLESAYDSMKIEPVLADGLKEANPFIRKIIEDGYRNSITKAVWIFEFLYGFNKIKPFAWLTSVIACFFIKPYVRKLIINEKPDKIIIFHFFVIRPVYKVLKELNLNIPVITVVTDPFTAHPIWFLNKKQNFIVFSEKLKNKLIKKGINPQNINVKPFIIDQKYTSTLSEDKKNEFKKDLGFDLNKKTLLILGGGDGMPKGKRILKHLIKSKLDINIILVCGRNEKLYHKAIKLKNKHQIENLAVFGFVDFVYELINISDIVLSKCGASTFMEILISGKIPVVNTYIWEQEKGNVDFIVENKMGVYEPKVSRLPERIAKLISDQHLHEVFRKNISQAGIENGLTKVAGFLVDFR